MRSAGSAVILKRALDVVGALALLAACAPLLVLLALTVRLGSRGPVLFRQSRAGRRGRVFQMLKFRTMYTNADDLLATYLARHPAAAAEWRRFRRLDQDPRVVAGIGRFLRTSSLDELPQLWNVLRGDMSLVGPRPLELPVLEHIDPVLRERRQAMRPGITGLWQVSGRSELDMDALATLDAGYVEHWSLWSDLRILARTPAAVLSRRGAY